MGEYFTPGWNHVINREKHIEEKEEKPELSTLYSQKDDEGEAILKQEARNNDIVNVHSRYHVGSIFGSSSLKRNADLASLPLIARPSGGKDRHSKVYTAKGPRDRRVRLSVPAAIQFYDIQDRLGYDQPSKAVDWLMKKAKTAIDKLPQPDFDQRPTTYINTRQAINYCPAPSPVLKLASPSFHAPPFAAQQFVDLNLTVSSTSTIANTSVRQSHSPTCFTIASTSNEPECMIHNSVLGITTDSLGQHMATSDSGEVGNLQGYPLARTDTRTKARERARERAKLERLSVKLEPVLLGSCNLVTEPAKGNPETFSSLSSMYNQILASSFQNENVINSSILEEYEAQSTHQQNQINFLIQDQAGQSFLNDSQETTSTFQDSTNNNILSYARPSCQMRNSPLSDVSAEVASPDGAFFHEQLAQDTNQKYNPLLDILTRASLQTYNSLPSVHTNSQEFYTSSSRSLSFLAPFSLTHIPSSSYSAAPSISDSQITASGNPLNNNVIKSVLTENNESCLSFFNPPQSTFQPTSHVDVGGYQGRYLEYLISSPKFVRSPQKLSSTEYDPLIEDMLITSQGHVGALQTFNLASGTLQEQIIQSNSGQFIYSSAASPRKSPDANSHDLYEKDSRVISNADSFTPYGTPASKFDGTFEIEEQSKRSF